MSHQGNTPPDNEDTNTKPNEHAPDSASPENQQESQQPPMSLLEFFDKNPNWKCLRIGDTVIPNPKYDPSLDESTHKP